MTNQQDIELFTERAQAVSAVVERVPDMEAALTYAVELAKSREPGVLAAPGWGQGERDRLTELCGQAGVSLLTEGLRARAGELGVGLTGVDWGAAATGTMVLDSNSEDLRLASMLSEIHVAVLPAERIRPDLESLEDELSALMARRPSYLAFITGASRTADIELVLTIGAHGPVEVHVVIVGEPS